MSKQDNRPRFSPDDTPFITPEALKTDYEAALNFQLKHGGAFSLVFEGENDPELFYDENAVALGASTGRRRATQVLNPVAMAFVAEILRYGHKLHVTNDGNANRNLYVAIKYDGTQKDETTINRLILNIGPGEQTKFSSEIKKDIRREFLDKTGGSPATKNSRQIAIQHARNAAAKHRASPDRIKDYISNLEALFALHDEVNGVSANGR